MQVLYGTKTSKRQGRVAELNEIFSKEFDDIYFAAEDGLAESRHVFLKGNNLPENWSGRDSFVIAETGFGTGLNFLATWQMWDETTNPNQHLTYISVEKYPLSKKEIRQALSRWRDEIGARLEIMLEKYPLRVGGWHKLRISKNVTVILIFDDVNRAWPELKTSVDAWFLDGHAPAKNPDMWSEAVFKAMAGNTREGATFASFTAAGIVKNGLRAVGFEVSKTRGFGRKRDMILGRFSGKHNSPSKKNINKIAVIGAGLAGTRIARLLQGQGKTVCIYDEAGFAFGASGNRRGLYNPRFTSFRNEVSDFYASGFSAAHQVFKNMEAIDFDPCGNLHLVTDDAKDKKLSGALESWNWHPDHMRLLTPEEASDFSGTLIQQKVLLLTDGGSVNPSAVCKEWAVGIDIKIQKIESLQQLNSGWAVNGENYDAVVLTCGTGLLDFQQIHNLPLQTVRGQVTYVEENLQSAKLKANISYGGYCGRGLNGRHIVGSTFQPWLKTVEINPNDDLEILSQLTKFLPQFDDMRVVGSWASLRVAANDRFPIVGKISGFSNLYISGAHGSHGLISSIQAAEAVVEDILGHPPSMPQSVLKMLSPQRFKRKKI